MHMSSEPYGYWEDSVVGRKEKPSIKALHNVLKNTQEAGVLVAQWMRINFIDEIEKMAGAREMGLCKSFVFCSEKYENPLEGLGRSDSIVQWSL